MLIESSQIRRKTQPAMFWFLHYITCNSAKPFSPLNIHNRIHVKAKLTLPGMICNTGLSTLSLNLWPNDFRIRVSVGVWSIWRGKVYDKLGSRLTDAVCWVFWCMEVLCGRFTEYSRMPVLKMQFKSLKGIGWFYLFCHRFKPF